ncbi:MAG TPA: hydroxyphenylacetyl-CoA thioesterase PaaI [Actinophytocola sp.]|nr:hydroxyphenylacetyl-CoA thioesterase PaaI [Actinophytocola sp.]
MTSTDPAAASRHRAGELYERDLTCQTLGIRLGDVAPGRASVRMRVGEHMVNGHGTAHGGYLFLLADAAFSYACNTHGPVAVAQGAHVTFLQPVDVGDELVAEATERARRGLSGIYDVTVSRDGAAVAEFRGHSVLVTRRPA